VRGCRNVLAADGSVEDCLQGPITVEVPDWNAHFDEANFDQETQRELRPWGVKYNKAMHDAAESSTARCCQKREFWHQPLVFRSPFTMLNLFRMLVVGIAWSTPRPTTTADRACV
jgi:hypothetical protein